MVSPEEAKNYDSIQRRHKRRVWREKGWFSDYYIAGYVVGQEVSEGGSGSVWT